MASLTMLVPFKRKLKRGSYGSDVEGVSRALCKAKVLMPLPVFSLLPLKVRRRYGGRRVKAVKKFQLKHNLKPRDGIYRQEVHKKLLPYFDAYGAKLVKEYSPPPPKPKLVEPRQGYHSLHQSLLPSYSVGRNMGLSDLGTYNPASRLPSGYPSDHAIYPSKAYDLGFSAHNRKEAEKFFNMVIKDPNVEYAIFENKIWSRGRGMHSYGYGGHYNHVHVSGIR